MYPAIHASINVITVIQDLVSYNINFLSEINKAIE